MSIVVKSNKMIVNEFFVISDIFEIVIVNLDMLMLIVWVKISLVFSY